MKKYEIIVASMEVNDRDVIIDGRVFFHVECDYGADADNNRGEKRTFVDYVADIKAYDASFNEVKLSEDDNQRAGEILTRKFLEA